MCLFENAKILVYNIKYQSREEARDMIKFFTIRLELAQTSFMLFVESTYFFLRFAEHRKRFLSSCNYHPLRSFPYRFKGVFMYSLTVESLSLNIHIYSSFS